MKAELNINMLITQLRRTSYELGYANGRIEALRDYLDAKDYAFDQDERAILGIQHEEIAKNEVPETKDDLEEILGYTE